MHNGRIQTRTIFEFRSRAAWQPGEDLEFLISCASGTYARSLVHELGEMLGCGAALSGLRRSRIGSFEIENAIGIEDLRQRLPEGVDAGRTWIPFDDIPLPFDEVVADAQQERRIQHGQTVLVRDLKSREGDWIKVLNQRHRFIAVGSVVERIGTGGVGVIQPRIVFK